MSHVSPKSGPHFVQDGRSTGYALVASGEWPSITIGRSLRVPVEALREWVARRMRATDSGGHRARGGASDGIGLIAWEKQKAGPRQRIRPQKDSSYAK